MCLPAISSASRSSTGDDYVVSKMIKEDTYDENKVPYLKIYDAVILEGKDLKDGKLISY